MSFDTFLQIFLIFNVFVLGAVAAIAGRHAYAHFRPHKHEPETTDAPNQVHLSPAAHDRLLQEAEDKFKAIIEESAGKLNKELGITSERIGKSVSQMGADMVAKELEHYRAELEKLRRKAEEDMGGVHNELSKHSEELKVIKAKELEEEKQRLLKQIDTKLADAVASFLIETMQHNVDLGAQTAYLTAVLEEHKADFARQVSAKGETAAEGVSDEA
ncbi:MAG TPA: hypothetical protein VFX84_02160 [Candidatus Saccharimonadales bacterium]|nr:hypothetical protein [Candidatus Saccharimonadales bacterium]